MSTKNTTVIYSVPKEEAPATDYVLTVNGQPVFTYQARVSAQPFNQVWPGYQRPLSQTEIASFASWDMSAPVEVVVSSSRAVKSVQVRPQSSGIKPHVEDDTIRFTIARPGQYTVEVNGLKRALHIFANPPEEAKPVMNSSNVIFFGPGVHNPGLIHLKSGQTIYIDGGAVVYGAIQAEKASDISILGRGILDGSKFGRLDGLTGLLCLYDCSDVRIDGITLRDPPGFTIVPINSRQVRIRNVKLIGNWRYNTDGIDFINCQHCSVEDSFIRSFDDSICLKGYESFGPFIYALQLFEGKFDGSFTIDGKTRQLFSDLQREHGLFPCHGAPLHDIQVRRCVIWNDWGRAMELGLETVASHISDVLFEDCDVIHVSDVAMDVQNGDHAQCREIIFRDIRVELDNCPRPQYQGAHDQLYNVPADDCFLPRLIVLNILQGYCNYSPERGQISDIRFENISVTAPGLPPSYLSGFDDTHLVQRVSIENLRINGQLATTLEAAGVAVNEFVRDVKVRVGAKRILILGNSITFHGAKPEIGWTENCGMAASALEKDYSHLLLKRLSAVSEGRAPEALIENIAAFEREYRTYDFGDKLAKFADFKADIIVLAIGENVPQLATAEDQSAFRKAVTVMLTRLKQDRSPAIFVRSSFWADPVKDAVLREICRDAGGTFVDISALGQDEKNYARSERQFTDAGVAAHPGDTGMSAIAEAIWKSIENQK